MAVSRQPPNTRKLCFSGTLLLSTKESGRLLKIDEGTHPVLVGNSTHLQDNVCTRQWHSLTPRAPPAFASFCSCQLDHCSADSQENRASAEGTPTHCNYTVQGSFRERETLVASSGFTHLLVHLSPLPPRIHTLKRATGGWLWRQWLTPLAI